MLPSPNMALTVPPFFIPGFAPLTPTLVGNIVPNMSSKVLQALSAATLRILRPLVRILLRNGVSYGTFADLAKWVYVDVATRDFGLPGRKQSVSRVSVITGLSRKEVVRVQELPHPEDQLEEDRYNRAAKVITSWHTDHDFLDRNGDPLALPFEADGISFSELVKRYSGDVPARAVLDELLRVGSIQRLEDGRVIPTSRAYIPQISETDKLHILGTDVGGLVHTIDHNLNPETGEPRFQRKVFYDNLPDEAMAELRHLSAEQGQTLLEHLNDWMAKHDRDSNPGIDGSGRNSAGIGIYYFENPDVNEKD